MNRDDELTREQINRQDLVDNAIHQLILDLIPNKGINREPFHRQIDWNIEIISEVREVIQKYVTDKGLCTEAEFYPYLEESE